MRARGRLIKNVIGAAPASVRGSLCRPGIETVNKVCCCSAIAIYIHTLCVLGLSARYSANDRTLIIINSICKRIECGITRFKN